MATPRRNEELIYAIGKRLRELRAAKGLSQVTVTFDTDIHIARLESGRYNINVSTLSILCDYYEISLVDFFKGIRVR